MSHTFLFTVQFPNGTSANDNPFMGKSASIDSRVERSPELIRA